MKTLSLKTRFAVVVSIGALALVVGLGALSMHFAQADLLQTLSDQQLGLATRAAQDVDAKLQLAVESLDTAATAMPQDILTSDTGFGDFFAQHPSLLKLFDELVIVSASGIVTADFPASDGRIGVDVTDRRYFIDGMALKKPLVSAPIRHRVSGLPIVSVVVPIRDPDGRVTALMVGVLSLTKQNLLGDLTAAHLGRTGYFVVTTGGAGAVYLAHPDGGHIMREVPVDRSPAMAAVVRATGPGSRIDALEDGSTALVSHAPIGNHGWMLAAVLPSAEAFVTIDRARDRTIRTGVAIALVVLALVWLFASWLLRPLDRLRAEVEQIGKDRDRDAFATVSGDDEVSRVARAFNAMLVGQRASEALRVASDRDRQRLVAILESSHDIVAMTDTGGRVTYLNASGRTIAGIGLHDDLGDTSLDDYLPPWAVQKLMHEGIPVALEKGVWLGETAVRTVDGVEVPVDHTLIAHRDVDGRLEFFSCLLHDTSAAQAAAAAMRSAEARMLSVADAVTVMVSFIDRDYRFRFVNSRYEEHFGVARAQLLGRSIRECVGDAAYAAYEPFLARAAAGETVAFEHESHAGVRPAHFRVKVIPQRDDDARVIGHHLIHQDVTDHKVEHERLSQLVRADALTGLLNRAGFEVAIAEAMQRSRKQFVPMALFYLDVDRFKTINDEHGHLVGDALLRAFAERLLRAVRSADIVARLGGDEFVVIAEGLRSVDDVRAIARKVLRAMRTEFRVNDVALSITTTVGIATYSGDAMEADALIHRADAALYRAKKAGRDRWDLDDPSQPVEPASMESGEALEMTMIL